MIRDKARELGRMIGQSDECKALRQARDRVEEAQELKSKVDRLEQLAGAIERGVLQGDDPSKTEQDEYDKLLMEIQADMRYQQLVAAQSNFGKLMLRVNEQIAEGMQKGAESPIITLG